MQKIWFILLCTGLFCVQSYAEPQKPTQEACQPDYAKLIPLADPALGVFGVREWIRVRLGFSERPKAAKDMIVPFVVIIRQKGHLVEDRSEHYLVDEFNTYYDNKLSELSTWPSRKYSKFYVFFLIRSRGTSTVILWITHVYKKDTKNLFLNLRH